MPKELSSSKLLGSGGSFLTSSDSTTGYSSLPSDYEELIVTIKKSERGLGFDLKNGILIQNVFPSNINFKIKIKLFFFFSARY